MFTLHKSQAQRPGRAQRIREFRGLPRLRQSNSHARRRWPSRAQRLGRAQRRRGFGGLPRLRHNKVRPRAEKNQAQRPFRAQRRRGVRRPPPTTAVHLARTPKEARQSTAARPSALGNGGLGASPKFDTTQRALAQKKVKRSGQSERCGEGGFGVLPRLWQPNSHARQSRLSREQRQGRAQRRRGARGSFPTTTQQSTPTRTKKPSAAARRSEAEKEGSAVSPGYGYPPRTHAKVG